MIVLNETKPPLDEAVMHYGVKGMKWGQRRAERAEFRARTKAAEALEREFDDEIKSERRKKILAGTALTVAGVAVTAVVLKRNGHLKVPGLMAFTPDSVRVNGKAERDRAANAARKVRDSYKNSDFANKTFRPENVGNPLWTRVPKTPKAPRDFVDAGFGKDGVFNVTTMSKGSERVNNFSSDIWDMPMLELTTGRK